MRLELVRDEKVRDDHGVYLERTSTTSHSQMSQCPRALIACDIRLRPTHPIMEDYMSSVRLTSTAVTSFLIWVTVISISVLAWSHWRLANAVIQLSCPPAAVSSSP
jgi:hypothetical protein